MSKPLRSSKKPKTRGDSMNVATGASEADQTRIEIEQVFWKLVTEERNRAIALAYHIVGGDLQAAEDVAQEAFLRAYKALPGFRGQAKLSTWFYRILVNRAKSHRRWLWVSGLKSRCLEERFKQNPERQRPDAHPVSYVQHRRMRARIRKAMGRLSLKQRAVFGMVHLEGCSLEETAMQLAISIGTAKSHLHRALSKLRQDLKDLERSMS